MSQISRRLDSMAGAAGGADSRAIEVAKDSCRIHSKQEGIGKAEHEHVTESF